MLFMIPVSELSTSRTEMKIIMTLGLLHWVISIFQRLPIRLLLSFVLLAQANQAVLCQSSAPDVTDDPFDIGLRAFGRHHAGDIDITKLATESPIIDFSARFIPQVGRETHAQFCAALSPSLTRRTS